MILFTRGFGALELCFKLKVLFSESLLFCIQQFPCSTSFSFMLKMCVEIETKNYLY